MTTTKEFLKAIERYAKLKADPEQALRELDDENFRLAFFASAELFRTMRTEAIRRGIWDEIKTKKVAD